MASEERDYSAESMATINKWQRKKEHAEMVGEAVIKKLKEVHAKALKNPNTKKNLAREILHAYRNRGNAEPENISGFSEQRDGLITGYEPKPWEDNE